MFYDLFLLYSKTIHKPPVLLLNITVRRSRLSGVARATIPDKQSHHVMRYCAFAGSKP
jgi:hypothetical protein